MRQSCMIVIVTMKGILMRDCWVRMLMILRMNLMEMMAEVTTEVIMGRTKLNLSMTRISHRHPLAQKKARIPRATMKMDRLHLPLGEPG